MLGIVLAIFNGLGYIGHTFMNNITDEQERKLRLVTANNSDPNEPITYIDSNGRTRNAKTKRLVSYVYNGVGDLCLEDIKSGLIIYNYDEVKRDKEIQKNKELAIQEGKLFYSYKLPSHEYFKKVDDDSKIYDKRWINIIHENFPVYGYIVYVDIITGNIDFSMTDIERAKQRFVSDSKIKYHKSQDKALKVFDLETDKCIAKFKEEYRRY